MTQGLGGGVGVRSPACLPASALMKGTQQLISSQEELERQRPACEWDRGKAITGAAKRENGAWKRENRELTGSKSILLGWFGRLNVATTPRPNPWVHN